MADGTRAPEAQLRQSSPEHAAQVHAAEQAARREKTVRERLERERVLLDAVLSSIPDHIYMFDRSGRYTFASLAGAQAIGLKQEEIVGKTWRELGFPAESMEPFEAQVREVCASGQPQCGSFQFPTVSGVRDFEYILTPVKAGGHGASAVMVTARDVTERKRLERELQAQREELIYLISHDLRSPLTMIMGYADLLRKTLEQAHLPQQARQARAIVKSAGQISAMIAELVDSARLEAGQTEMNRMLLELQHLIDDLVERVGTPKQRPRIRVECRDGVPPVMADRRQIERAITNLLTNALKYSPPDEPVTLQLYRRDETVVVAVTDRGAGIPASDIPRLFQRFSRARSAGKREGLGLGLYITRLIAEAHGGEVSVESEAGKGSTFYLRLPLQ